MQDDRGRYASIPLNQQLTDTFRNWYWDGVKLVLREIFNKDDKLADEARNRLETLGIQTIFYHASPLEVAADLAERPSNVITREQMSQYQEKLKSMLRDYSLEDYDQPPSHDLEITHPEDIGF